MHKRVKELPADIFEAIRQRVDQASWKHMNKPVRGKGERDYYQANIDLSGVDLGLGPIWCAWALKTKPGGFVHRHTDKGRKPSFTIPIKTSPNAAVQTDEGLSVLEEGVVYSTRRDVLHWSRNESDQDRIHLIVEIDDA